MVSIEVTDLKCLLRNKHNPHHKHHEHIAICCHSSADNTKVQVWNFKVFLSFFFSLSFSSKEKQRFSFLSFRAILTSMVSKGFRGWKTTSPLSLLP